MSQYKVVQDDYGTSLIFTILDQNNKTIDLSGASTTIDLNIKRSDTTIFRGWTSGLIQKVDPTNGKILYTSQPGDFSLGNDTYTIRLTVNFGNSKFTTLDNINLFVAPKE
jgi:hypothetical protein